MRLSVLVVATILLFSAFTFAQHSSSSTPSAPSAPASPPPSAPASSSMHSSAPSMPGSVPAPVSHPAPASSPSSNSTSSWNPGRTSTSPHTPESDTRRIVPAPKVSGDEKIVPTPRIGKEPSPSKDRDKSTVDSDLRKRNCLQEPCKEKQPEPKSGDADLRRRICTDGPCAKCPLGETAGKNGGCVATPTRTATNAEEQCPGGYWNGSSCVSNQCPSGTYWNGVRCVSQPGDCATSNARAAALQNELRMARVQKDNACRQAPSSDECMQATQQYESRVLEYQTLQNEAPTTCRTMLGDPLAF